MSAYLFLLTGSQEKFLVEVEASSLSDLAQVLSCSRFVVGRMVAVDDEFTSRDVLVSVNRIELIVEPD